MFRRVAPVSAVAFAGLDASEGAVSPVLWGVVR